MRNKKTWLALLLILAVAGLAFAADSGHDARVVTPDPTPNVSTMSRAEVAAPATDQQMTPMAAPSLGMVQESLSETMAGAVHFSGNVSFSYSGSVAELWADYVYNESTTTTTGTLRMSLWFSSYGYRQAGYRTAAFTLGTLPPLYYFYDIYSGTITFSVPPTGCYYVSMLLEEYQSGNWYYVDYVDYTNLQSINNGCSSSTCTYGISPAGAAAGASGGSGTVTVTGSPSGCSGSWTAHSNSSWITITSGTSGSGSGPGTVSYTVAANGSSSSRTGSMTVAGYTFPVTQEGTTGGCVDDLSNGTICLRSGRYKVEASWLGFDDDTWRPVIWKKQSDETALGVFQNNQNDVTMIAKMVWGCPYNNYYWFWLGGFTDAGWYIVVTDTQSSLQRTYTRSRQAGSYPTTLRDDTSFTCP